MFIIDVIPLVKIPSLTFQILSYFSVEEIEKGAFLEVPLGKTQAFAIVLNCSPIKDRKMEIKKGDFELKNVKTILSAAPLLSESQLELALWMSNYYLSPLGPVIKLFLLQSFLKRKKPFSIESNIESNYELPVTYNRL